MADPTDILYASPASEAAIQAAEEALGRALPESVKAFYRVSNGAFDNNAMFVHPVEHIAERHHTYEADEYAPGWQVVGDDSGGRMIMVGPNDEVLIVDAGSMTPAYGRVLAPNLMSWVEAGMSDGRVHQEERFVDIYLSRPPEAISTLMHLRETLALDLTASEVLKVSRSLPGLLATRRSAATTIWQCARVADKCLMLRDSDTGEEVPIFESEASR
jgi:hypothetical protein